jgi:nucleoside-diphosphate-sugar epimerase
VEPGEYLSSPLNLDYLSASLRLGQLLARNGCRRLVVAGTCFEYATQTAPLSEDSPTNPASLYAASKRALSIALTEYCRGTGMELAWLRFFYLYGPQEHPSRLVPSIIHALRQGRRAELTLGEQLRDFLHVADAASAVVASAGSTLTGPVNIGSGTAVTVRQVAAVLGRLLGRPDLIAIGARPYPKNESMHIVADNHRLCQTGWHPQYDLRSGLQDAANWWQAHTEIA